VQDASDEGGSCRLDFNAQCLDRDAAPVPVQNARLQPQKDPPVPRGHPDQKRRSALSSPVPSHSSGLYQLKPARSKTRHGSVQLKNQPEPQTPGFNRETWVCRQVATRRGEAQKNRARLSLTQTQQESLP